MPIFNRSIKKRVIRGEVGTNFHRGGRRSKVVQPIAMKKIN